MQSPIFASDGSLSSVAGVGVGRRDWCGATSGVLRAIRDVLTVPSCDNITCISRLLVLKF